MTCTVARQRGARALLLSSAITLAACSGSTVTETPVPVVSIELSATTVTLNVGQTAQLTAVPKSAAGDRLTARLVVWATQTPDVATVSSTGLVSAVGPGTTTITATSGSVSAPIQVTVVGKPHIALSSAALSLTGFVAVGGPVQQTVNVTNSGGGSFTNLTVGSIQYGAGQPTGWLSAALAGSGPPTTLTVTATVGNLAIGTYTASFNLSASGAENSPTPVTVSFVVSRGFRLSIAGTGAGNGTVVGGGINCTLAGSSTNGTCVVALAGGTSVTLTGTPQGSGVFNGWNGPCTGTGNCVVTVTSDMTVGATFSPHGFNLAITGTGTGSGTVVGSGGINCTIAAGTATGVCQVTLLPNSTAQLTETATGASGFSGWGGACSGMAPTCTLSMTAAASVTAGFTAGPPTIVLSSNSLQFSAIKGGANAPAQTVTISNAAFGPLTGLTLGTIQYGSQPPWLTPTLITTTNPPTLTLQPVVGTLAVGSYTATVPVIVPTATNNPQNITVAFAVNPPPLTVTTVAASNINQTNAQLNGLVNQDGNPYTASFEWGTDSTLSQVAGPVSPPTGCLGMTTCSIGIRIFGLTHGRTYYFRFDATNGGGTGKGAILSFTP